MKAITAKELWDWLSRSVPGLGIAAHVGYRADRLRQQRQEDVAYAEMMESMGEKTPRFSGHSEHRERHVLAGELTSHVITVAVGAVAYLAYPDLLVVWLGTWLTALGADWVGGRVGGWVFDRKQPSSAEITNAVFSVAKETSENETA